MWVQPPAPPALQPKGEGHRRGGRTPGEEGCGLGHLDVPCGHTFRFHFCFSFSPLPCFWPRSLGDREILLPHSRQRDPLIYGFIIQGQAVAGHLLSRQQAINSSTGSPLTRAAARGRGSTQVPWLGQPPQEPGHHVPRDCAQRPCFSPQCLPACGAHIKAPPWQKPQRILGTMAPLGTGGLGATILFGLSEPLTRLRARGTAVQSPLLSGGVARPSWMPGPAEGQLPRHAPMQGLCRPGSAETGQVYPGFKTEEGSFAASHFPFQNKTINSAHNSISQNRAANTG